MSLALGGNVPGAGTQDGGIWAITPAYAKEASSRSDVSTKASSLKGHYELRGETIGSGAMGGSPSFVRTVDVLEQQGSTVVITISYMNHRMAAPCLVENVTVRLDSDYEGSFTYEDDGWGTAGSVTLRFADDASGVYVGGSVTSRGRGSKGAIADGEEALLPRKQGSSEGTTGSVGTGESSGTSTVGTGKSGGTAKGKDMPSLSNSSDHRALNVFLSNFSEAGLCLQGKGKGVQSFDRKTGSAWDWQRLVFAHCWQNGSGVETVTSKDPSITKLGTMRLSKENADKATRHLCGVTVNWAKLSEGAREPFYKDGYLYEWITDGYCIWGPAVATGVSSNSDGTLLVDFDAYYYDNKQTKYDVKDGSQYGKTEKELNKLLGVDGPNAKGQAVLEAERTSDGWKFALVRYEVSIDWQSTMR